MVYQEVHGDGTGDIFPEKLVCERVELIQEKKEDVLLDELAEKLSGEEKKNEFVVMDTEFGEKSFRMCDVKGVYIVNRRGEKLDITDKIQAMFEQEGE